MNVLWLVSWYPNKTSPFNGDFIQRHARAVSARCPVTVIHVVKDQQGLASRETETVVSPDGALTEKVSYLSAPRTPFAFLNRAGFQVKAFRLYARAIREYVSVHGRPRFIHVHVCMNAGIVALWAKYRWRIPYLVTEHFSVYIPESENSYRYRPFLYRFVNKRILAGASGVHNVSRFLQGCEEAITPLARPVIIPNAVDTEIFRPTDAVGPAGPFRFIHISSFDPLKNVTGLLEAFAILSRQRTDWELTLVGAAGEELRAFAQGDAQWTALEGRLRWAGTLSYREVGSLLRQADALVLFSLFENQPCVISEALCCGLPVISSNVGGIAEEVTPDRGILVPRGDRVALALALNRLMQEYDRFGRRRIAASASERYGYNNVGRLFMEYYAAVFRDAAPGASR